MNTEYVYSEKDVTAAGLTATARAELVCVVWQTAEGMDSVGLEHVIRVAIEAAEQAAAERQMEADCQEMCAICHEGKRSLSTANTYGGIFVHLWHDGGLLNCGAHQIRRAWAAVHPAAREEAK